MQNKLFDACLEGNINSVEKLIENGCNINETDKSGNSALKAASNMGHIEIVRLLLSNGADVNIKNENRSDPLIGASFWGHSEIVNLLLEHGADVNNTHKSNILVMYVSRNGGPQKKETMKENLDEDIDKKRTALMDACHEGNVRIAKSLVKAGADVNAKDYKGDTPMFLTITGEKSKRSIKHQRILQILINANADINAMNDWGGTALMGCSHYGQIGGVEKLLDAGANVSIKNQYGATALDLAKDADETEIVEMLELAEQRR